MKVSELTSQEVWRHLREDDSEEIPKEQQEEILLMQKAAISFIRGYTGLTEEELDEHEDITIAALMLIADMYDNRQLQVEKNTMNKTAETILGLHCVNFL